MGCVQPGASPYAFGDREASRLRRDQTPEAARRALRGLRQR